MKRRISAGSFWMLVALAVMTLAGCGPKGPAVTKAGGTVTHNGAAVADASVTYVYEGGESAGATTDKDGKYVLSTAGKDGAPIGKARVTVTKYASMASGDPGKMKMGSDAMVQMYSKQGAEMKGSSSPNNALPSKYASPDTSGIEVEVKKGDPNQAKLELTD